MTIQNIPAAEALSVSNPKINSNFTELDNELAALIAGLDLGYLRLQDFKTIGQSNYDQAITDAMAALPANGGTILLPNATVNITQTVVATKPITFQGAGFSGPYATGGTLAPWNPATEVVWQGAAGGTMFQINGPLGGVQFRDFGVDGGTNSTFRAGIAFYLDRWMAGVMKNIGIRGLNGTSGLGIHLLCDTATAAQNCSHNLLQAVQIRAPRLIEMTGSSTLNASGNGVANVCHITFHHLWGVYGDATNNSPGIVINDADNVTFSGVVHLFRNAGTGYGVDLKAAVRSVRFDHLQAGDGGMICRTPNVDGGVNTVRSYDRENGQPAPVLEPGARLDWNEDSKNGRGLFLPNYLIPGKITTLPGATSDLRGFVIRVEGATGVADGLYLCRKKTDDTYEWLNLAAVAPPVAVGIQVQNATSAWTAMPAALTELRGLTSYRVRYDMTNAIQARIVCRMGSPAGFAGSELRVQYAADDSTWAYLDGVDGPKVSIDVASSTRVGSWVNLAAGAKVDATLRVVGINGDGAVSPAIGNTHVEFRR